MSTKHAIVTGSSRGVGKAIAQTLLADGWSVSGVRRQESPSQDFNKVNPTLTIPTLSANLFDQRGIEKTVNWIDKPLSGIVCNAGIVSHQSILTDAPDSAESNDSIDHQNQYGSEGEMNEQIGANLVAPLQLIQALLNTNKIEFPCSIVLMSSNLARRGLPGYVAYCAAKAGIEGATRALARELGPRNIRVNAVAPGLLRTDMTREMGETGYQIYAREVPLGRVGEPLDIAPLVSFLLGESSGYITGQVIDVDGGWAI